MQSTAAALFALLASAAAAPLANADTEPAHLISRGPSAADYAIGARVGGYGFRNTQHADVGKWDDCRMEGMGVFAQRSVTRNFFVEAAFDLYTARDGTPTAEMPIPGMDRISGTTTVAGGARVPWKWFSPYVQLGVGVEVTRVEMASHGLSDRAVLPTGFFGIGTDLRLSKSLSLGGNIRNHVMKHYVHGNDGHMHEADDGGHTEMAGEYDTAVQGQLFVRYQL